MRRARRVHTLKRKRRRRGWLPGLVVLILIYVLVVAVIPPAALQARNLPVTLPNQPSVGIPWPNYGQAAIGAVGFGLLAQHGDPKPLPMASVAKVVTALAVLKQRPIIEGQPTGIITITADDVATYKQYLSEGQSYVPVEVGEQLTQYQALQALLLPSANNIADILARWAFGSQLNYLEFVNPFTKTLGLKNTTLTDASGFSPQTVSTAEDLTLLAEIAMNTPIIAEIVSQPQADLPVAGTVYNVNRLVGHNGIIGIKTGNTDEAGGCYLFSVRRTVAEQEVTLVGAIMGAPNLSQSIDDALPLIESSFKAFAVTTPIHTSQIVGEINQPGGKRTPIVVRQGLTLLAWGDQKPDVKVKINGLGSSVKQNEEVGNMEVNLGNMSYTLPLVAADSLPRPSLGWRIRHVGGYL